MENEKRTVYLAMEVMKYVPIVKKDEPYTVLAWKDGEKIIRLSEFDPYNNIDHAFKLIEKANLDVPYHIDYFPNKKWFVQCGDMSFEYNTNLAAAISNIIYRMFHFMKPKVPKI
jgi:hypothetical protein